MNKKIKIFLTTFFSIAFLFLLIGFAKADCYYFCSQKPGCDCGTQGTAGVAAPVTHTACLIGSGLDLGCGWGTTVGGVPECTNAANTRKCKGDACPDEIGMNGQDCIVKKDCFGLGGCSSQECPGKWDAGNKWCVECSGKMKTKRFGRSCSPAPCTGIDVTCGNCDGFDIPDTFETACDSGVDTKCEDQVEGDACGTGGTCDANGQCIGEIVPPLCSDGIDNDGDGKTDFPADPGYTDASDNDEADVAPPGDCELTCTCTCPAGIPCPGGQCKGGLVPCGRTCDDPCTKNCECAPCTLCHLFVLFKRIVDFLTLNIIFPLAVLMIVVGGAMFLTAGGDPGRIGGAKKILTATVIGLAIILAAWLIVDTVITFLTPAGSPFQNWSTIDCPVCGDGNCDSGETSENCPADCGAPPPPVCTSDFCNGNCPEGCGGADDPDCPGQCLDCACATDNDCASSCTAGDGCCPGCAPADPDCPICVNGTCDTVNRRYCDAGTWTPQDDPLYCSHCSHCTDGVKNCSETGIDCGGGGCPACAGCPPCIICP